MADDSQSTRGMVGRLKDTSKVEVSPRDIDRKVGQ